MHTTIRNTLAALLLVVAALAAGAALLGANAARLIDTPGPLQRILGPLAGDPGLRAALPERLGQDLARRITEQGGIPQLASAPLDRAIALGIGAMLDEPGFGTAWAQTIEASRADFTAGLAAARGQQITLRLDIAPLLGSSYAALHASVQGSALGALLPEALDTPPMYLDTGLPRADQLPTATLESWLAVARGWGWLAAGALAAAAAGLALATAAGRPRALLAGGAAALLLGTAALAWFASLGGPGAEAGGAALESLVTSRLLGSLAGEFSPATATLMAAGIATMVLGAAWARRHARRRRAGAQTADGG